VGNVAAEFSRFGLVIFCPAARADIPALKALHAPKKDGVVRLFVLERRLAFIALM
jgi:hypothetical protein